MVNINQQRSSETTNMTTYVKLSQVEHVLHRPDMYVGSTHVRPLIDYIAKISGATEGGKIEIAKQEIEISPAMLRIFIEVLSNAVDNVERSQGTNTPSKKIKVVLTDTSISIYNDGVVIPIALHPTEKCYNHSLLFGSLLTGSNYDDQESRTTSGRNGLGVKLCFEPTTPIRLFNGSIRRITDLSIGDQLISADGAPCEIIAKTNGFGKLYRVRQEYGMSYVVNGDHLLCLYMPAHGIPTWNNRNKSWIVEWLGDDRLIYRKEFQSMSLYTCPMCKKTMNARSVREHNLRLHKIDLDTDLKNPSAQVIQQQKILAYQFAQTLPRCNHLQISVQKYRALSTKIRSKLSGYMVDPPQYAFYQPVQDPPSFYDQAYCAAFGSFNSPFLPDSLMYGSVRVRLEVLAGIVDRLSSDGYRFRISLGLFTVYFHQEEPILSSRLISLSRSLGYVTRTCDAPNGQILVSVFGHTKFIIPCRQLKINLSKFYTNVFCDTGILQVEELQSPGDFVGIQVSRQGVFALADYTAVHNCNIFSKEFTVESVDPAAGLYFQQTWSNNMSVAGEPLVRPATLKKGYTKVTWTADTIRLGLSEQKYTPDILSLFSRYVVDVAMWTSSRKVFVFLNDTELKMPSLVDYARLYPQVTDELLHLKLDNTEAVLLPSSGNAFESVSFVNGIYTSRGGKHVDSWAESIFRPIVEKFNGTAGKSAGSSVTKWTIADIRKFYRLYVTASVINPEFNGQEKEYLESPSVVTTVTPKQIQVILKWPSTIAALEQLSRTKEVAQMKKIEKNSKKSAIDNYDPANKAGSKQATECSLFITEGLSAKTYVVAGIQKGIYGKAGRDWNGVLPIRGKLLNVREKTASAAVENTIIKNMVQALGLRYELDYSKEDSYATLNYGRLVLVADADADGLHIESLCINFIHSLYPSLLKRESPFIVSLKTPIVRVSRPLRLKQPDLLFYDEQRFHQWYTEQSSDKDGSKNYSEIKYYKGLGTTRLEDVPDTFGLKIVEYQEDAATTSAMLKAFHKDQTDDRKEWVGEYVPGNPSKFSLDSAGVTVPMAISDFIEYELVKYSYANCQRSLPSMIDGLKVSQRKILYAVFKRGLKYTSKTMKVAQLAGYTAEHSNYHHGENNLSETIMGMAYDFVGSNNIPLLYRDGAMGTRLEMGNDAASPRYVFTKLDALSSLLYREEDAVLLEQVNDDGDLVEPYFYVPIIPMVLVNGSKGIGTGWSTTIPCYNPLDMVDAVRRWLSEENQPLPSYKPWYRSFTGDIQPVATAKSAERYTTEGVVQIERGKTKTVLTVTELPIGMATSSFVAICEKLRLEKKISKVVNYSTITTVQFQLEIPPAADADAVCSLLGLKNYLSCNNMVALDAKQKIVKYGGVHDIIYAYCVIRFEYYKKRRKYQIDFSRAELLYAQNKFRFVKEIMDKSLLIMEQSEEFVYGELSKRNYDSDPRRNFRHKHGLEKITDTPSISNTSEESQKEDQEENQEESTQGPDYEYLLRLQMRSFTSEKLCELQKEIEKLRLSLTELEKLTEKEIWLKELDEFSVAYEAWLSSIEKQPTTKPSNKKGKQPQAGKKK